MGVYSSLIGVPEDASAHISRSMRSDQDHPNEVLRNTLPVFRLAGISDERPTGSWQQGPAALLASASASPSKKACRLSLVEILRRCLLTCSEDSCGTCLLASVGNASPASHAWRVEYMAAGDVQDQAESGKCSLGQANTPGRL